jgi:hypothetical protein
MGPWTVPYGIAVVLLVAAGVAKVIDPRDTAGALARSGRPVSPTAVRIGAAFEVGLGVAALVGGTRTAAVVVALSYLVFAAFVTQALVRGLPVGSCGCFGRVDTPPSAGHVAVNLGCAVAAVGAALGTGAMVGPAGRRDDDGGRDRAARRGRRGTRRRVAHRAAEGVGPWVTPRTSGR